MSKYLGISSVVILHIHGSVQTLGFVFFLFSLSFLGVGAFQTTNDQHFALSLNDKVKSSYNKI